MRQRGSSKPPWPSWVSGAVLVGVILLQLLNGILTDLAVELLPKGWAQRRWALVVFMLVIATALAALLAEVLDRLRRSAAIALPTNGERHADIDHSPGQATIRAPGSGRSSTAMRSPAGRTKPRMLLGALGPIAVGMTEALAMLGFFLRMVFYLVNLLPEPDRIGQNASDKQKRERPKKQARRPKWDEGDRAKNVGAGLLTALLLLFVSTNSASADPNLQLDRGLARMIYVDSLASPSSAWRQDPRSALEQRGHARFFTGGTYRIAVRRPSTRVESVATDPRLRMLSDTKVQVGARAFGGPSNSWFGLFCRQQRDRYYFGAVNGDGEYQIAKVTKAGPRTLGKGLASAMTESAVSVLELICLGGGSGGSVTIALRVNGVPVGTHEDALQPLLRSGGVGIMAETGDASQDPLADSERRPSLEVVFEDFMVWTR